MKMSLVVAVCSVMSLSTAAAMATSQDALSEGSADAPPDNPAGMVVADCGAVAPTNFISEAGWHNALARKRLQERSLVLAAAAEPAMGWHNALATKRLQDRALVLASVNGWHTALGKKRVQDRELHLTALAGAAQSCDPLNG